MQATWSLFEGFDDGGDAEGEDGGAVDGFWANAADEHFAGAAFEGFETAAVEAGGESLRHFEEVLASGFDGLAQENEESRGEFVFVDVAGDGDITRFDDGLGAMIFLEVGFDFLA